MMQCDLLLARCDEALGDLDAEVTVCRRALTLDPTQAGGRLMLAAALSKLGRGVEALEECQRLADSPQASPEGRLLMARLLILQNLRLPADRRQWDQVKQILDKAGDAPEVPLLRGNAGRPKGFGGGPGRSGGGEKQVPEAIRSVVRAVGLGGARGQARGRAWRFGRSWAPTRGLCRPSAGPASLPGCV